MSRFPKEGCRDLQLMSKGALLLQIAYSRSHMGGECSQEESLTQAKQRFGARVLPLRSLKHVYLTKRFAELCQVAGVDPSDRAGIFPPYRAVERRDEYHEVGAVIFFQIVARLSSISRRRSPARFPIRE